MIEKYINILSYFKEITTFQINESLIESRKDVQFCQIV